MSVNGVDCESKSKKEVAALVKASVKTVKFTLQYNPAGLAKYDDGAELKKAKLKSKKSPATPVPESTSAKLADTEFMDKWYFGAQDRNIVSQAVLKGSIGDFVVCAPFCFILSTEPVLFNANVNCTG